MLAADAVNGQPVVKGSEEAFSRAISRGVLSDDPEAENYVGLYMYMYIQGVEDSRSDYIGSIVPRSEGDEWSVIYPHLLLAGEPTLIEGSLWDPENGITVVYDATMPQGLSLLRTGAEVNFTDPTMVIDTISESPSEWVYQAW